MPQVRPSQMGRNSSSPNSVLRRPALSLDITICERILDRVRLCRPGEGHDEQFRGATLRSARYRVASAARVNVFPVPALASMATWPVGRSRTAGRSIVGPRYTTSRSWRRPRPRGDGRTLDPVAGAIGIAVDRRQIVDLVDIDVAEDQSHRRAVAVPSSLVALPVVVRRSSGVHGGRVATEEGQWFA